MTTTEKKPSIVFHTNGDIDPLSWEVIGMSAKLTDNAVGMFGSGLKFSLAVLLRNNHAIYIISNGKRYEFGTTDKEFRVTCNGKELGITTDMGMNWILENAYRELVSNTMDEGGIWFRGEAMEDGTSIVVEGEEFADIIDRHNNLFVGDREPFAETTNMKVYKGNGLVFYRGVKVANIENAKFSYEFTNKLSLTEDRTLNVYSIHSRWEMDILASDDKNLIRKVLTTGPDTWEHSRDYDWHWGEAFREVATELWESNAVSLPPSVQKCMRKRAPEAEFKTREIGEYQEMLDEVLGFLKDAGYNVKSEIKLVDSTEDSLLGFYHNKVIHLTEKSFEKGKHDLAVTVLEEHFHSLGHSDCCRGFQDYLLNQLVTQMKKRLKNYL